MARRTVVVKAGTSVLLKGTEAPDRENIERLLGRFQQSIGSGLVPKLDIQVQSGQTPRRSG
jgi:glutamate 5-kinase